MRFNIIAALVLLDTAARGQNFRISGIEYMDTTSSGNPACAKAAQARYYSVNGKYPRSAETLAEQAQAFIGRTGRQYSGDGHVTFRFAVDCQGRREPRTQVLQTDVRYQRAAFSPALVSELYAFLQTLTAWEIGKAPFPVRYLTYLDFNIRDGKVVAVTP